MHSEMDSKKVTKKRRFDDGSAPHISAKSWSIIDGNTGEILFGKHDNLSKEIASLTKIMTAYTVIRIIKKLDINVLATKIEVSELASMTGGTTAQLCEGDVLCLWDMMHGLMLPSGNDAAVSLAEFFGELILELSLPPIVTKDNKDHNYYKLHPVDVFVQEMNGNAKELRLRNTYYANPHGLKNFSNKSTASDIAKLAAVAMHDPMFREIVKRRKYTCIGLDEFGNDKVFTWTNTNKLLSKDKSFNGVKTGITPSAGPCLCSSYQNKDFFVIVVVLSCKSPEYRWGEVIKLTEWIVEKLTKGKNGDKKETFGLNVKKENGFSNSSNSNGARKYDYKKLGKFGK
jgi:serine-type D-Ala-D-Ala carboxypeptidase (penicillin-binding protein 5/6)